MHFSFPAAPGHSPTSRPGGSAKFPPGGNEGDDGDRPRVEKQSGNFGDSTNVFPAVLIAKPEIGIEPAADVVSVEDHGVTAFGVEPAFQRIGNRALAASREAIQPSHDASLAEHAFLVGATKHPVEFGVNLVSHRRG